ncbi:MAG TPA: hypothetical protein VKR31_00815 [Rhizomicrobium sp.]|nr:hypothetical protein [Rhizomicrobium sp.]
MNLLTLPAVTTALPLTATPAVRFNAPPKSVKLQANFTYGSGGTSVDAYVQTSIDGGTTWCDVANFHFTTASARSVYAIIGDNASGAFTPTDGSIAANTYIAGLFGSLWRVKYTSSGTYAGGTALSVDMSSDQAP